MSLQPSLKKSMPLAMQDAAKREPPGDRAAQTNPCRILRLDEIQGETAGWVWPSRFYCGQVNIVAGEAGSGKSALVADIAARVTNGEPWPDATVPGRNSPAAVVIAQSDKHCNHVVKGRFLAAGGDKQRMAIVNRPDATDQPPAEALRATLDASLAQVRDCSLVVIDDLVGWLRHIALKPKDWPAIFEELAEVAASHQVALVVVWRLEKASRAAARRTVDLLTGLAPVVWLMTRDAYCPSARMMVCAQNRLGCPADNLAFEMDGDRLVWRRAARQVDVDDALATQGVDRHEREQAGTWLLNLLANGPIEANRLWEEARNCRLAERTVRRAAAEVGLHPMKDGQGGPWRWGWKKDACSRPDGKDEPAPNVAAFEPIGSLARLRAVLQTPPVCAAQCVAASETVGSLPKPSDATPARSVPATKTVAAFETVGNLPAEMRPTMPASSHKSPRRRVPTVQQLDDAIDYRLGRSPLSQAGGNYGDSRHIQIAPKPRAQ